jgi:hypothetical protein
MAKASKIVGAFFPVFFTTVLAPVLVHILTDEHDHKAPVKADTEARVIVQGIGATPDEAWYEAQRTALREAVMPMVDAQTLARDGKCIWATVFQNVGKLITRCQDLECTCNQGVWHREVMVFIARAELADRLRAAHVSVVGDVVR